MLLYCTFVFYPSVNHHQCHLLLYSDVTTHLLLPPERWMFCVFATRFARLCLSEALAWSLRRHAFGRPLAGHAIIRARIAEMARAVEAAQSNLDELTFQILKMPPKTMSKRLGGPIALAKANASRVFELCAREAAHVRSIRGGEGPHTRVVA